MEAHGAGSPGGLCPPSDPSSPAGSASTAPPARSPLAQCPALLPALTLLLPCAVLCTQGPALCKTVPSAVFRFFQPEVPCRLPEAMG